MVVGQVWLEFEPWNSPMTLIVDDVGFKGNGKNLFNGSHQCAV